jgi:hypothetical protein
MLSNVCRVCAELPSTLFPSYGVLRRTYFFSLVCSTSSQEFHQAMLRRCKGSRLLPRTNPDLGDQHELDVFQKLGDLKRVEIGNEKYYKLLQASVSVRTLNLKEREAEEGRINTRPELNLMADMHIAFRFCTTNRRDTLQTWHVWMHCQKLECHLRDTDVLSRCGQW